jgi:hypothetical protein
MNQEGPDNELRGVWVIKEGMNRDNVAVIPHSIHTAKGRNASVVTGNVGYELRKKGALNLPEYLSGIKPNELELSL